MISRSRSALAALLTALAFVITIACILVSSVQEVVVLGVGDFSDRNIFATRTFENRIATAKLRVEASESVATLYKQDPKVMESALEAVDSFFADIAALRAGYLPITGFDGVAAERTFDASTVDLESLDAEVGEAELTVLVTADSAVFERFYATVYALAEEAMAAGVKEDSLTRSLQALRDAFGEAELEEGWAELGFTVASSFLTPNLVTDEEMTQRAREEAAAAVEAVMYYEGQKIVGEGESVTDENYAALVDLGVVDTNITKRIPPIVGAVVICAACFSAAMLYIARCYRDILLGRRQMCLLFTLYVLFAIGATLISSWTVYVVPILLVTMLISALIDTRLAFVLNICMTVIGLIICDGDTKFFIFYALSGMLFAWLGSFVCERNRVFQVSLLAAFANALMVAALYLLIDMNYSREILDSVLYAVFNGLISVLLTIGSLPLWEAVFGIVTPLKLLDLTNPGSKLMRRMGMEAPGTYQHSLMVANLAEAAAYDIGADHILARVGAYYHDIGKLKSPQYFAENQYGENPHDYMEPRESAKVLKEHVRYGLELAAEHKLPNRVADVIEQHHGTTMMKYFYFREKNNNPGEEIDAGDFRYPYKAPVSKESAIVMLADTAEAAVRSVIPEGRNTEEIEAFVRDLIKDKLDDGQMDHCGLTIKDLTLIRRSFMRVFRAMYHERIPYPEASTKELEE